MEELLENIPVEKLQTRKRTNLFMQWLLLVLAVVNSIMIFFTESYALIGVVAMLLIMVTILYKARKKIDAEIQRRNSFKKEKVHS